MEVDQGILNPSGVLVRLSGSCGGADSHEEDAEEKRIHLGAL